MVWLKQELQALIHIFQQSELGQDYLRMVFLLMSGSPVIQGMVILGTLKLILNALFVRRWLHGNSSLRLTYIMGDQCSGITWEGISREKMAVDRRYNPCGRVF
jgi:hypothetical protein